MVIDRSKVYEVGDYTFQNFITLDSNLIEQIRLWRNHPDIRKLMYNSEEISPEQHLNFISLLPQRNDKFYWLVYRAKKPIGVVSIVDVDLDKEESESGYYMIPDYQECGLGLEFVLVINYFLYNELKFKHLFGRTQSNNKNALFINYYMGCKTRSNSVIIDGINYKEVDGYADVFLSKFSSYNNIISFLKDSKILIRSIKEFNKLYIKDKKMEIKEFIEKFAEILDDTDVAVLNPKTKFRELEEWSSLTTLGILGMIDEEYDVQLKGNEMREANTIQDLFDLITSKLN